MTFLLTEDHEMLRDTAMAFARDELPVTRLRKLRDSGANGVDPDTRQKLAELGFFGVIIPDEPGMVSISGLSAWVRSLSAGADFGCYTRASNRIDRGQCVAVGWQCGTTG